MGPRDTELEDRTTSDSTPEDVAVLYSWANLQGAKYRDYSASRRENRAQARYRAANALLERELRAQTEAEEAAAQAEREALEAAARSAGGRDGSTSQLASLHSAEEAVRKAAAERAEAGRRAEIAAHAMVLALREEREIADAHASAKQQALIYTESELLRRQLAGPQPHASADGRALPGIEQEPIEPTFSKASYPVLDPSRHWALMDASSGLLQMATPVDAFRQEDSQAVAEMRSDSAPGSPAWLYASQTAPQRSATQSVSSPMVGEATGRDTLQDSRERLAARWFALKGLFENESADLSPVLPLPPVEARTPLLGVFSLTGGVGKTSLVATLGRALSQSGERVVLTDTTTYGLLPFYFGARELRAGELRRFLPSAGKTGEAIGLVTYDAERRLDERMQETMAEQILRNGSGNHRVLLDLSSNASWLLRRITDVHPAVLVPIAPNMNSVISLRSVEKLFRGVTDAEGRGLLPFYVLNQFDASLPLHLDVREVFRRKLGDRLLPFAIRASPEVSEALAEGMTVVDYAPLSAVAQDYRDVALWLKSFSPPATGDFRRLGWGGA